MYYQPEQPKATTITTTDESKAKPAQASAVKQEPHTPSKQSMEASSGSKLEYTTLQPTLTPPSSASSSASSTSSSGSSKNKYPSFAPTHQHQPQQQHSSNSSSSQSPSKRKLTESKSHQKTPVYSEYLNSKCLLYIYYKGDILSVVDEHFKKSFTSRTTKSPTIRGKAPKQASARALSVSTNQKDTSNYSWSNKAAVVGQDLTSWSSPYPTQSHAHYQPYNHSSSMQATAGYELTTAANGNSSWSRPYNQDYTDYYSANSAQTQYANMGFIDQTGGHINQMDSKSSVKEESMKLVDFERIGNFEREGNTLFKS